MNEYTEMSNNMILFLLGCTVTSWFTSQLFKAILNCAIAKNFSFGYFFSCFFADGDFPSSHTCFSVTSLIITVPYAEEIIANADSTFADVTICRLIEFLWILFVFVIVKDAISVRGALKKLSTVVKSFLSKPEIFLNEVSSELQDFWTGIAEGINVNVGHMPHEVIGGLILAVIIGSIANSIRLGIYPLLIVTIIIAICYFLITFYVLTNKQHFLETYKKICSIFKKK